MSDEVKQIGLGIVLIIAGTYIPGAQFLIQVGVGMIAGGVALALEDEQKNKNRAGLEGNHVGGINYAPIIFGKRRTGGMITAQGTHGPENKYFTKVLGPCLAPPCGVHKIGEIWVDETEIKEADIDGSGNVTAGRFSGIAQFRTKLGTDWETADGATVSALSYLSNTFKGLGWAQVHSRFENNGNSAEFRKAFRHGFPLVRPVVYGWPCYDPRKDSTAGGSGTHRIDNPDTWEYSTNAALTTATYIIVTGDDGGMQVEPGDLNLTTVAAAANRCDETIEVPDGAGGSVFIPRFTCNIQLSTEDDTGSNLKRLLSCMAGVRVRVGGKVEIHAAQYSVPTTTIDSDWLAGALEATSLNEIEGAVNSVRATYVNEESGWKETVSNWVTSSTYVAEDDNRKMPREIALPGVTDAYHAQYLCELELERARLQSVVHAQLNWRALDIKPWEVITLSIPELDINGTYRVWAWDQKEDHVQVQLREEADYYEVGLSDFSEYTPFATPAEVLQTPPAVTGVVVTPVADGNKITFDPIPVSFIDEVEIWRSSTSGSGYTKIPGSGGTANSILDSDTTGSTWWYKLRTRLRGEFSTFSTPVSSTGKTVEDGANNRKYFSQTLEPDWDTQGPFSKGDVWKRYPIPADMPQIVVVFTYNGNTEQDEWVAESNYTDNTSIGLYSGSFSESFENGITDNWLRYTGNGTSTIEFGQGMGVTGGHVWQAVGEDWRYLNHLIPYDPQKLYRIRARARMTVAPSDPATARFYAGLEGVAADGVTLINTVGVNAHFSQHYVVAAVVDMGAFPLNEWQEFTGFFSGHSTAPTNNADNPFAPSTLYDGTAYFRPMFILNFDDGDGTMQVDYLSIEVVDASDVIINGPMLPYWKRVNNIPRPLINFGDTEHVDKHQDNIPDGPIFGRTRVNWLKSGRALIDLSDVEHVNKQLDYINDGTTYERVKALALTTGKIDLSKSGVISKTLDYIANTATFNKVGTAYADTSGRIKSIWDDVTGVLRSGGFVGEGAKRAQTGFDGNSQIKLDVPTVYVKYGDGTGIEALKPGEAGATKTAETGVNLLGADAPVEFSVTTADSEGSWARIYLDTVPLTVLGLKVGDTISFGAELKASGGDSVSLHMQFLNSVGTEVGTAFSSFFSDTSFTRHVVENVTIPANTFAIFFATDDKFATAGTVYSREAILTKGKLCPPYINPPADGIANLLPPVYEKESSFIFFQHFGPMLDISAFGIEPGDPITASVDLRVSVSGGEKIGIRLRFFDASKTFISAPAPTYDDNTGYARSYLTALVPANAVYADVGARFDTASPTGITGYWRRAMLTKGGLAIEYQPQTGHYLGLPGSGVQLGDNRQVRGAGILSYGSVQSASAVTFLGNGTVNIEPHNTSLGGVTTSYDAITSAVTGLTSGDFYVIACQDPGYQGGSPNWSAYSDMYQAQNSGNDTYIAGSGVSPSSGSTGGGGGSFCVCAAAFAHPWQRVGDVGVGDVLDGSPGGRRRVKKAYRQNQQPCVLLITESGVELPCSGSTPFTTRDGRFVNVLDMYGEQVLVRRYRLPQWMLKRNWLAAPVLRVFHVLRVPVAWYQQRQWETVVTWKSIGLQDVMAIDVGAESYAAGSDPFVAIISHNMVKPL